MSSSRPEIWPALAPVRGEWLRYAGAAAFVVAVAGLGFQSLSGSESAPTVDMPDAVLVDLPPVAATAPASDRPEGPEQEATTATPASPPARPRVEPKPDAPAPPEAATPEAAIKKPVEAEPAPAPPAPPAAAQAESAPSGESVTADGADAQRPSAAAEAARLAAWQRAMVARLERAKRTIGRPAQAAGTVMVAFSIDAKGRLTRETVARGSGHPALDRAALALVAAAAPFPAPPEGLGGKALDFTLPVSLGR